MFVENRLPALLRAVPPAAIALQGLFAGGVNPVHAQEPTPPPDYTSGIRTYCDRDASCFITEIWPPGGRPPDTGTVANALVASGHIDPQDAETCAGDFEEVHAQNLKPDPHGGRLPFPYSGMQFKLPVSCRKNLLKEIPTNVTKPIPLPAAEIHPDEQMPEAAQPGTWEDCLASIGVFTGAVGLANWRSNRKHRTGR